MNVDVYKRQVMLAGGDLDPDVIFVKDMGTQISMQEKGQIECLDKYIEKDKLDLSIYNGTAEELQIDGKQYTLCLLYTSPDRRKSDVFVQSPK